MNVQVCIKDLNFMQTWRQERCWKKKIITRKGERTLFFYIEKLGLHIPRKNREGLPLIDDAKIQSNINIEVIMLSG